MRIVANDNKVVFDLLSIMSKNSKAENPFMTQKYELKIDELPQTSEISVNQCAIFLQFLCDCRLEKSKSEV